MNLKTEEAHASTLWSRPRSLSFARSQSLSNHGPIYLPEVQIDMGKVERGVVFSGKASAGETLRSTGGEIGGGPQVSHLGWGRWYTLRELESATNGFADENSIGEGSYGIVYIGVLRGDGGNTRVAVKNLMINRWRDVDQLKEEMVARGIKSQSSQCWIQIDHEVHVFSENEAHPDAGEIHFELYQLIRRMKDMGYVPDVQCVYQQMDDSKKEIMLMSHPEKLAITYGLMKKRSSSPIRVIKSTRVCLDCHTTTKLISLITKCEIFLKDGFRFNHFREGKCSCKGCW